MSMAQVPIVPQRVAIKIFFQIFAPKALENQGFGVAVMFAPENIVILRASTQSSNVCNANLPLNEVKQTLGFKTPCFRNLPSKNNT